MKSLFIKIFREDFQRYDEIENTHNGTIKNYANETLDGTGIDSGDIVKFIENNSLNQFRKLFIK